MGKTYLRLNQNDYENNKHKKTRTKTLYSVTFKPCWLQRIFGMK